MADDFSTRMEPATRRWSIDGLDFAVDTAVGMTIRGRFDRVAGSYEAGAHSARIELAVDTASLDMRSGILDGLLRTDDSRHPVVRFTSTRIHDSGNGRLQVEGQLEAAGRVEPLAFDAAVTEAGNGLRLQAAVTVDRERLGQSGARLAAFLPATAHVTMHLSP
jgi:polyisoprenoid-binding protein YceI